MVNLDRFAQGLPDPQNADIVYYCDACGGEIYDGEEVYYTIDGSILHAEIRCLKEYLDVKTVIINDILFKWDED